MIFCFLLLKRIACFVQKFETVFLVNLIQLKIWFKPGGVLLKPVKLAVLIVMSRVEQKSC